MANSATSQIVATIVVAVNISEHDKTINVGGGTGVDLSTGETVHLARLTIAPHTARVMV